MNSNFDGQRRAISDENKTDIEENIFLLDEIPIVLNSSLEGDLINIFSNLDSADSEDSLTHALEYLSENKLSFSLSDDEFLSGFKSIISAHIKVFQEDEKIENIPSIAFSSIIPDQVSAWSGSASSWMSRIVQAMVESTPDEQHHVISGAILRSSFELISDATNESPEIGLYAGIEEIVDPGEKNDVMKYDGDLYLKFDPIKTAIFQAVSYSLAKSVFSFASLGEDENPSTEQINDKSQKIAEAIFEEVFSSLTKELGDQSLFSYEVTKVISRGLLLGAVSSMIQNENFKREGLPGYTAKKLSEQIAYSTINEAMKIDVNWELKRLAESSASGSAVGAQMAAILDKSLEYTSNWESYERKELGQLTSQGSALGATSARHENAFVDIDNVDSNNALSVEEKVEEKESIAQNARKDLVDISQHASMGSLIGIVGMSQYYPNPKDRLALINYAAQGATAGSVAGVSRRDLSAEGTTETFDVEIARSSSNGASFGATFETVVLTDANPKDFSSDKTTVDVVKAVSYGATYGAIVGDQDESGNSAPAADALIFKQATKQGSIEGSLAGTSLAVGASEENIDEANLRSRSSIVKAAATSNSLAASNANSTMATKAIKTSTADMLLLMKKFNINPRLTNPTRVFKPKVTRNEEEDLPFKEELQVASPI